jgi:antitoxin component YwqK of YwqJK toxin-antitoxin module
MNQYFGATKDYDSAKYYRLANYEDGKPIGLVKDYFMDGTLQFEGEMISEFPSVYDGTIRIYSENGILIKERQYDKGNLNGYSREWKDESLSKEFHYKNGKKDGFWIEEYGNGTHKGNYDNGERVGIWRRYKNDKQVEMRYYENGDYLKPIDLKVTSPINLIQILKYSNSRPTFVTPIDVTDWNLEKHLEKIIAEINSDKQVPAVHSTTCPNLSDTPSTLGHEAMYLIEGFIQGTYPPTESSFTNFDPDPKHYRKWWEEYQSKKK